MDARTKVDLELRRLLDLFESLQQRGGHTVRGLERAAGLRLGALRRELKGDAELSLRSLLIAVRGLDMRWDDFWEWAYPPPPRRPPRQARAMLPWALPSPIVRAQPVPGESPEERVLRETLEELLIVLRKELLQYALRPVDRSRPPAPPELSVDEEVLRIRRRLTEETMWFRLSMRALDRKMEAKEGTTGRILRGKTPLTMRHILLLLETGESSWAYFFQEAYFPKHPDAQSRPWRHPEPRPSSSSPKVGLGLALLRVGLRRPSNDP